MTRPTVVVLLVALAASTGCATESGAGTDPIRDTTTTTAPDGSLDCDTDADFTMQGIVLPDTVGAPTPEQELESFLSQWVARFGGDVFVYGERSGALVVSGRERVIAVASPAPAGGWVVLTTRFCAGYRL